MSSPAVILIFGHKPTLEWYEKISLQQCFKVLGHFPIRLICPENLDVREYLAVAPSLFVDHIPGHWLSSLRAYNRLKIMPFLYKRYSQFEFMLSYELDAFVFRDELEYWCSQNWDYVGGPWFEGHASAGPQSKAIPGGNSGFSLRKISSALKVLQTWKTIRPFGEIYREWREVAVFSPRSFCRLAGNLSVRNCFHHTLNRYSDNEDMFWSFAGERIRDFRLAPSNVAARFSFDCQPKRLYLSQGNRLPFGCHKWMGNDPEFWKPFIAAEGYQWQT
jgi:hypothetical protein